MASQLFIERFKDKVTTMNRLGEFEVDASRAINKPMVPQKSIMQISASNIIKGSYSSSVSPNNEYPVFSRPIKLQTNAEHSFYSPPSEAATEPRDLNPKNSYYANPTEKKANGYSAHQSPRTSEPPQKPKKIASAQPMRKTHENLRSTESDTISVGYSRRRLADFTPYTLKDYKLIKSEKYYELGGLGAYNIGTEEWEKKKELQDKKNEYAKQVMQANSTLLPAPSVKKSKEKELGSRQRAIEFAKKIPKPPLRVRMEFSDIKEERAEFEEKEVSVLENLEKQHEVYKNRIQAIRTKME